MLIDNTTNTAHGRNFKTFCCLTSIEFNLFVKATRASSHDTIISNSLHATGLLILRIFFFFSRELKEGALSVFDDSFEQEVWHLGEENSLVLVIEFWHPDISLNKETTTQ